MHKSIEWAAGLFEGEGTMYQMKVDKPWYACRLKMTDKDVIDAFADLFPYGTVNEHKWKAKPHHKDSWYWQIAAKEDVIDFLDKMLPYFGNRRAHKALDILDDLELTT